jgi:hypothetical protein
MVVIRFRREGKDEASLQARLYLDGFVRGNRILMGVNPLASVAEQYLTCV